MNLFDDSLSSVALKGTEVFPSQSWSEQQIKYLDYEKYWSGSIFDTVAENLQVESGQKPLRWPVKWNIVKMMIIMHSMALFGDWDEETVRWRGNPRPVSEIVYPGSIKKEESARRQAETAEDLLHAVWAENNRDILLIEQELARNTYGGCVFRVRKEPKLRHQVKLETVNPYYFKPIWNPGDYHELIAAKIEYHMDRVQAISQFGEKYATSEFPLYSEEWDPREFKITVGGIPYTDGKNEFDGRIPFVYIPRMRMGQFYGDSICESLMGIQDEINDRIADIGDQILAECHSMVTVANYAKDIKSLKPTRSGIINLGISAPGKNDPRMDRVPAGDIPRGAIDFIRFLVDISRSAAFVPAIAFGEDEGSQRSGVTLVVRMWPLIQQCKWSRAWWDAGFRELSWLIMKHMEVYGLPDYVPGYLEHEFTTEWASVQPKDREALVNEAVALATAHLQSRELLIQRLGDAKDDEKELAQIQGWLRFEREMQQRGQQAQMV